MTLSELLTLKAALDFALKSGADCFARPDDWEFAVRVENSLALEIAALDRRREPDPDPPDPPLAPGSEF